MKLARMLLPSLFALSAHAAEVYRWVDDHGTLHYSQTPPPAGRYEKVRPDVPPPTPAPAREALGEYLRRNEDAAAQQDQARARERERAQQAQTEAERCAAARRVLTALETGPRNRMAVENDDGTLSRMTDEQWASQRARALEVVAQSCS